MAHFAQLDKNSKVIRVIVIGNSDCLDVNGKESEAVGASFCQSLFGQETNWVQTSYNGTFRKNFAGIGWTYDAQLDAFIAPKPFNGWVLNTQTFQWDPPLPMPADGNVYRWDDENSQWSLVV